MAKKKSSAVGFSALWNAHPSVSGGEDPCSSEFTNQCAIRVGVALASCGVDTTKIPGVVHCWHHENKEGHILRAEELANGLSHASIRGVGKQKEVKPADLKKALKGKTGIIFFKDYWQRDGETSRNRSGDHIDLWNGTRLTTYTSWFRIQLGLSIDGIWSDFGKSKKVLFWPVS